jgi:hypothetical protein
LLYSEKNLVKEYLMFEFLLALLQIANPIIVSVIILLLIILIVMFVIAFAQGREVALGSIKIGARVESKNETRARKEIINDSSGIVTFNNRTDYTNYRAKQLRSAQKIDDVTWRFQGYGGQTYSKGENSAKNEEALIISQIIKRPDVVWRGVAAFTRLEHLERERPFIIDPENVGYNFGIYEVDPKKSPPLAGFMIIDNKELLIAYPHKDIRLAIQNPQIVKLYSEYFEDIWQMSHKLKQGNKVDFQKLQNLESELQ